MILKFHPSQRSLFLFMSLAAFLVCLSSCELEMRASVDWAKQKEAGNSAVSTFERTLYNIDCFFEDIGAYDDSKPIDDGFDAPASSMTGRLGFQGGLGFVAKGAKYDLTAGGGSIGLNYIEIPVYGIYRYSLNDENKIYGGLGPYLAYGVGGKLNSGGSSMSSFGENAGGYKRFDLGPSFELGYQYKAFTLTFSYDLGLLNVAYSNQDFSAYNRSFAINLGYRFGKMWNGKK